MKAKNKIFSRVLMMLGVLQICLYCVIPVSADVPQVVKDARQSIVHFYTSDGETVWTGSGFVIAKDGDITYVATNLHVVTKGKGSETQYLSYISVIDGNVKNNNIIYSRDIGFYGIPYDNGYLDIAIVGFKNPFFDDKPVLPLQRVADFEAGDSVYALGFPGVVDDEIASSEVADVNVTEGIITKHRYEFPCDYGVPYIDSLSHSASINGGNSGGPLLSSNGSVIGINTWGTSADTNLFFSQYIDYLIDYCNEKDIPIKLYDDAAVKANGSNGTDKKNNPMMYVAIGVAVIVVFVIVISAVKKPANVSTVPQNNRNSGPNPQVDNYGSEGLTVPVNIGRGAKIRGIAGVYAWQTLEISNTKIFGRNPKSCSVVFPQTTQGVSSVHCEILNSNSQISIIDKNSTYGTYLNGNKLTANNPYPLKTGDKFWLGAEINSFEVI
jgi:hypothetical protein